MEKFKLYLSGEKVQWIKEFVMFMSSTFGNTDFLKVLMGLNIKLTSQFIENDSALNYAAGNGLEKKKRHENW